VTVLPFSSLTTVVPAEMVISVDVLASTLSMNSVCSDFTTEVIADSVAPAGAPLVMTVLVRVSPAAFIKWTVLPLVTLVTILYAAPEAESPAADEGVFPEGEEAASVKTRSN
jgi:hypothetical protein